MACAVNSATLCVAVKKGPSSIRIDLTTRSCLRLQSFNGLNWRQKLYLGLNVLFYSRPVNWARTHFCFTRWAFTESFSVAYRC